MKSRKPAIIACVLLALALPGMGVLWFSLYCDAEWLRIEPANIPDSQGPWIYVVVRGDDLLLPDVRFDEVKCAFIASVAEVMQSVPHEGQQGSREWPRACAWYGLWTTLPQGWTPEDALSRLHKDMQSGLFFEKTKTLHWRAAVVDPQGRTRVMN